MMTMTGNTTIVKSMDIIKFFISIQRDSIGQVIEQIEWFSHGSNVLIRQFGTLAMIIRLASGRIRSCKLVSYARGWSSRRTRRQSSLRHQNLE